MAATEKQGTIKVSPVQFSAFQGNPVGELDGYDSQEHAGWAQGESHRAESAGHGETPDSDERKQRAPAERRSRQEYASDMRASEASTTSEPSGQDKLPAHESLRAGETAIRDDPSDRPRDASDDGRDTGPQQEGTVAGRAAGSEGCPGDQVGEMDQSLRRRLAGLESESAKLAGSNAQLAKNMKAIEARLERLEHASENQAAPTASGRERSRAEKIEMDKAPQRRAHLPRWASNEAIGLAAAVGGGTLITLADFMRAFPATFAGIGASALGVGAAGLGWYRKRREEKDAARRRH
jgi:hypothetical protein